MDGARVFDMMLCAARMRRVRRTYAWPVIRDWRGSCVNDLSTNHDRPDYQVEAIVRRFFLNYNP